MSAIATLEVDEPSICIAWQGQAEGRWLSLEAACHCPTLLRLSLEEMLPEDLPKGSWWIVQTRGFAGVDVRGCDPTSLCAVASLLTRYDASLVHDVWDAVDRDVDGLVQALTERYAGQFDSLRNWAECFLEDTGALLTVGDTLRDYIDFSSWARDAEVSGDIWSLEQGLSTHVFWGH